MPPLPKRPQPNQPYWSTTDGVSARLYLGHVLHRLRELPAKSVHSVITSPPYWGLRDYGTGTWEGGDLNCDHVREYEQTTRKNLAEWSKTNAAGGGHAVPKQIQYKHSCLKCGAKRVDHQLGSEPSPDCDTKGKAQCGQCFVCNLVAVFREVRRVLRDDGTLWLNLGDTYGGGQVGRKDTHRMPGARAPFSGSGKSMLPDGNLVGVPWRVALALQVDGWVLRQEVIWHKPCPMPESVRNRCTKAHEQLFMFAKSTRYYYDHEVIKDLTANPALIGVIEKSFSTSDRNSTLRRDTGRSVVRSGYSNKRDVWSVDDHQQLLQWLANNHPELLEQYQQQGTNRSDVWKVSSQGYPGAHFATFPPKLIEPCILAGTSEYGCCASCGKPWVRVTEETKLLGWRPNCTCNGRLISHKVAVDKSDNRYTGGDRNQEGDCGASPRVNGILYATVISYTSNILLEDHPVNPCTVLDPFVGSGTTVAVALRLGRYGWGIDLSEQYLKDNAIPRIEGVLLSRPALAHLVYKPTKRVTLGKKV